MDNWKTAIATSNETDLRIRGYDIAQLMRELTFTEMLFLLNCGRLPSPVERRLLDAILIAVAEHGSGAPSCAAARIVASGNRESLAAAIAAGVLALGDAHGGSGQYCMEMIAAASVRMEMERLSVKEVADDVVVKALTRRERIPGLGHRVHTSDPRTPVLFGMARELGIAGKGMALMEALANAASQRIRPLTINVGGALAGVLYDLGLPAIFGKLVIIVGRVAGLTAEVAEEYQREKAMRIRIPVIYDGLPPRCVEKQK